MGVTTSNGTITLIASTDLITKRGEKQYVAAMGGPDAVTKLGREAFQKGDYRWGAELVNHLVFTQPDNQDAKNLCRES